MATIVRKGLVCFAVATGVALAIAAYHLVPANKHASVLGLVGSLLLALPPLRQLHSLYPYAGLERFADVASRSPSVKKNLQRAQENRADDYMKFSAVDPACILVGAAFLFASFIIDAIG
ncbi:hypothetical protein [Caballeronia grimmiae]|uniref:hypothetical protein n=1 Tax=Caballeronia grimmiae TaxID=1071679 RepID=UPI0038BBB9F0